MELFGDDVRLHMDRCSPQCPRDPPHCYYKLFKYPTATQGSNTSPYYPSRASQVLTDKASSVPPNVLTGYLRRCLTFVITSTKRTYSNTRDSFRTMDLTVNLLAHLHHPAVAFFRIFLRIVHMINGHDPDLKLRVLTFYAAHLVPNPCVFLLMPITYSVIGIIFGAIHCIAWSIQFISLLEQ
jgi:hypothetical protein